MKRARADSESETTGDGGTSEVRDVDAVPSNGANAQLWSVSYSTGGIRRPNDYCTIFELYIPSIKAAFNVAETDGVNVIVDIADRYHPSVDDDVVMYPYAAGAPKPAMVKMVRLDAGDLDAYTALATAKRAALQAEATFAPIARKALAPLVRK